ncbi:MAG: PhzF family phenazine biosynthesis protein, partial [Planctomycetota bacterium]
LAPDLGLLRRVEGVRAVGVTAPGEQSDFASRLFAPVLGIDEDPVTGSLHSLLTPFWAERFGRDALSARQISRRGGSIRCVRDGDRVRLAGKAVTYLEGTIRFDAAD